MYYFRIILICTCIYVMMIIVYFNLKLGLPYNHQQWSLQILFFLFHNILLLLKVIVILCNYVFVKNYSWIHIWAHTGSGCTAVLTFYYSFLPKLHNLDAGSYSKTNIWEYFFSHCYNQSFQQPKLHNHQKMEDNLFTSKLHICIKIIPK